MKGVLRGKSGMRRSIRRHFRIRKKGGQLETTSRHTAQLDGPIVTRAGEGVAYRGLSFVYEFLGTTAAGKQMSPVVGTVHARRINGPEDFARHAGEEFAYVLSGEIDVHFDNGDVVRLARGDSLYFDSRIGHAYVSVSRQLAKIVGVITTESSFMQSARADCMTPVRAYP